MPRKIIFVLLLLMVAGLVGCDHTTKALALAHLAGQHPVEIIPGLLDLSYAQNTDVGFGALRWIPTHIRFPLLVATGIGLVFVLAGLLFRRRQVPLEALAYGALLAGAIGNVGDRVLRGFVVDFIHVHRWPVFNVADICLVVGIGLLLLVQARSARAPALQTRGGSTAIRSGG